jgi:hypothetical protein
LTTGLSSYTSLFHIDAYYALPLKPGKLALFVASDNFPVLPGPDRHGR